MRFIFFGNYFYGACAVALSVEAAVQQHVPLNELLFYVLVFLSSVIYYNIAYITERPAPEYNERTRWYNQHLAIIRRTQLFLIIVFAACAVLFFLRHLSAVMRISLSTWLIMAAIPFVGVLYYGINHKVMRRFNLRRIGWLKPFSIGLCWAGLVSIFPIIYQHIQTRTDYHLTFFSFVLFIKNFMFISLLCILFDIKDYSSDFNLRLKTFVVEMGLRNTIFLIIIPLSIIGFGSFLAYTIAHHFGMVRIIINSIPFILLITVSYSLQRRRSILYYLIIIDGLMLVKAACGVVGMLF